MQNLINDLLALSRVSTHSEPFSRINLDTILAEVLSDLEVRIEETAASIASDPLPEIEADPTQIRPALAKFNWQCA